MIMSVSFIFKKCFQLRIMRCCLGQSLDSIIYFFCLLSLFKSVIASPIENPITKHGFNDSWNYAGSAIMSRPSHRFKGNDIDNPYDGLRDLEYCHRKATCQELKNTTCLGTKLTYRKTTLELIDHLDTQERSMDILEVWKGLTYLPRCWAVIQPFLCSLYMPKCDDGQVDLPSQEMCKLVMGPCKILTSENAWPLLFSCNDSTTFPSGCKNDVRELKFNTTGKCQDPMVPTDSPSSYYEGVEGCGVQCDNPMFTPHERYQIHRQVAVTATICLLLNFFAVATFMIDWKCSTKFPALIIFYINLCFLFVCLGWLAQFLPGGRDDIVCRKDGTLRIGEPNARGNLSCVVVFVLVYYFLMAGIVWFVILTYAYHSSFQALGKIQERMDKKGPYFHIVAWCVPFVLTVTSLYLGEVDGNSVTGVCFVGILHQQYRVFLFLLPVFAALCVSGFFLSKGLLKLIALKSCSEEILSDRARAKIRATVRRMSFIFGSILICGCTTFACHIYEFRNTHIWNASFRKYIVCRMLNPLEKCLLEVRPSLAIVQLHLLALFSTGVAMSSWVWTKPALHMWARFCASLTNKPKEEHPLKLKKHKVIALAFAKRKMLDGDGRLSISISGTYQDPVGLNFELNSMASGNLSSTWAAALPKLVTRRGALVGTTNSNSSQGRNSVDSEISYSVRRVSVESRRHSLDSLVSVQVAEVTKTVRKSRPVLRVRRHRRRRSRHTGSRRGSSSSQDSEIDTKIMSALAIGAMKDIPPVPLISHNQKRREATAGITDDFDILAQKLFTNLAGSLGSDGSQNEEVTRVRETLIMGRLASHHSDDQDQDSDDATQPLTKGGNENHSGSGESKVRSYKFPSSDHNSYNFQDSGHNEISEYDERTSNGSDLSGVSRTSGGK